MCVCVCVHVRVHAECTCICCTRCCTCICGICAWIACIGSPGTSLRIKCRHLRLAWGHKMATDMCVMLRVMLRVIV